jgi:uroporphyrinogen decarboxylase
MRDYTDFFQPAIYEHAAAIIHKTPWQVSRDENLLVQAHSAAYERYGHTPITVGIDIYNLEAEAYGATVNPVQGQDIPTISTPLFEDPTQLLALEPLDPAGSGRLPMLIKAGQKLKRTFPKADIRIPVSGPFSIASLLLGFETLLMTAITEIDTLQQALNHLAALQFNFLQAIQRAELKVTLFESAATPPLISPALFKKIELEPLSKLIATIRDLQGISPALILGGDTALLVDDLVSTGAGYLICPAETDQDLFMKSMQAYPDVMIRINMQSRIVAAGSRQEIFEEVHRVLRLAESRERVCIGTGVLPYETPIENVLFIQEFSRHHV